MTEVVVLGAGYAGLRTVRELSGTPNVHVTLIDRNSYHYEATALHTVAIGTNEANHITFDIRKAIPKEVTFKQDNVTRIDPQDKTVTLEKEATPLKYDYLVVALGFESEDFGIKGAATYGLPLQDIGSAKAIRKHLEERLAAYNDSHDERDLHIIVCGAGFTSIELLGELVYRMPSLVEQYHLPADKIQITCLEAMPKILPMFDQKLVDFAVQFLADHGAIIHTSTPIDEVTDHSVISGDNVYEANTIIWTTGVRGSHVISDSQFDQKRNRVAVTSQLTMKDHPEVFIIGDSSAVPDPASGRFYPTTGQISIAQATHTAKNIKASIDGTQLSDFTYKSLGTVCSLGPTTGIAEIGDSGRIKLKGRKVALVKKMVNDRSIMEESGFANMMRNLS
ncbi:MAG: NAD(P)/FAD-dependent oxidoreductase [Furfurilactobacillus sp.]|jgi:NADH dehydrogenase|uniref:NAD(P)/FAD-dependent oxidoreductase n=1 Tax=Furfurilactobacillus TaxID=2767882 RepID=UPI0015BFB1B1|nr:MULTISPECIES: NAD(P)/FAD-dependent oxidoreductase [Furfurilactobacillus]QLE67603.1 NADH dehydrogenase [Furfurilactobacillus rossiae]MCF6161341.1 NAD(P)/FAD-dependent oxidoreductase [Furfurilactobacillus milii]MCF6163721.1 NAD(P)/FAD-dependent oxidoreductase [Furfurilactobacillus milii]MCF6419601.1 NAD(P)/FAD-dependent oxidoreductase [Furfurilactobacillus milii]MCH4011732.1 NAD(P)/FAD-dependent oxidoreductase [Furfurilactobacillus sp.]